MSDRHEDEKEDDKEEVGYGKPPKHSRFRKGQSGNPKGRPKRHRNFRTDLMATLNAPVQLKEKGRSRTVTTQQAALYRLREKALSGDVRSLDRLLELARVHDAEDLAEAASAALPASDLAILDNYMARRQACDTVAEAEPPSSETSSPSEEGGDDE